MGEINRRTLGNREKNMVLFIEILLIGVGLSMDAFAVSICKGLGMTKVNRKQALTIGLYFGGFQALMPFIGYMLGIRFEKYITSIDHWIAFILLGFIGGKMVYEAVKEKDDDAAVEKDLALNQGEMLLLAIATSIDALAVGIMFAFTYDNLNIYWAIAIIGLTTFVLSIIGVVVGNFFGNKYKKKSEIAGGTNMENFINNAPFIVVLLSLIVGFVFLVKGADLFVEGSSSVAKRFKVPSLIIGLTIVAMGTSLPETAVSVAASIAHNNTLAVSNVTGSNIFNLMVVIGVCALMTPVVVDGASLKRDFPFSMICAILLLVMGTIGMTLGRVDGIILLGCFAGYIFYLIRHTLKQNRQSADEDVDEIPLISMPKAVIFILIGAVGIAVGGDVVVDSASRIAIDLGMSQTLVGLTIVSIGTSLPELVTSIVAARKNEVDMALGNAVGSCIFNILMVLGVASAISPIAFIQENIIDIIVLVVFSLIVWIMAWTKREIKRGEGIIMLLMYAAYTAYIIIR